MGSNVSLIMLTFHSLKLRGKSHPLSHHETVALFLRQGLPQISCVYHHINSCSSSAGGLSWSCFPPVHFRIPTVLHASCSISNVFLQTTHPNNSSTCPQLVTATGFPLSSAFRKQSKKCSCCMGNLSFQSLQIRLPITPHEDEVHYGRYEQAEVQIALGFKPGLTMWFVGLKCHILQGDLKDVILE